MVQTVCAVQWRVRYAVWVFSKSSSTWGIIRCSTVIALTLRRVFIRMIGLKFADDGFFSCWGWVWGCPCLALDRIVPFWKHSLMAFTILLLQACLINSRFRSESCLAQLPSRSSASRLPAWPLILILTLILWWGSSVVSLDLFPILGSPFEEGFKVSPQLISNDILVIFFPPIFKFN